MDDYGISPFVFLLVEDDDDHAKIVERSLRGCRLPWEMIIAKDGAEALGFLTVWGKKQDAIFPKFILLDLNLPKVSGHDVLIEIKNNPQTSVIPTIVLSTSDTASDKERAYRHNANSYLVKPLEASAFISMIDNLCRYWGIWNRQVLPLARPE